MPKIVERKPHPQSAEHEIIAFTTKVRHEMQIPKGLSDADVMKEIVKYLKGYDVETPEGKKHVKGYEDVYPETAEVSA